MIVLSVWEWVSREVYPPEEALRRAQPLPPRDRLVIEDVPQDDWEAFQEALDEA